uniref:UBX domain-containing protein 4 n=1 Tax=Eptatretus burgeri TaxID=7764 RepID=A0A8C4QHA0_EPTBU
MWFQGPISSAISSAKLKRAIFVVFVAGEDAPSQQTSNSWEDARVVKLASESCVAVRVDAKSETCTQFCAIYEVSAIPSCFFIGDNGIPLRIAPGGLSADELLRTLETVVKRHQEQQACRDGKKVACNDGAQPIPDTHLNDGAQASSSPSSPSSESQSESQAAAPPAESPIESKKNSETTNVPLTDEERNVEAERLTKRLEERREQKHKEEEEMMKMKEIERRRLGKDVNTFKRRQEEDRTKRLLEERIKEKAEEKSAREKILKQIALDRAERAVRYGRERAEGEKVRTAALAVRTAEEEEQRLRAQQERNASARIQFRLPDGSSITKEFPSETTLGAARHFVAEAAGNAFGNFTLAMTYPRHVFTDADLSSSLLHLELVPTAVLILLPGSRASAVAARSATSFGMVWTLLEYVMQPIWTTWNFLSNRFFAPPSQGATTIPTPTEPAEYRESRVQQNSARGEALLRRRGQSSSTTFRRDGNIFRLGSQGVSGLALNFYCTSLCSGMFSGHLLVFFFINGGAIDTICLVAIDDMEWCVPRAVTPSTMLISFVL